MDLSSLWFRELRVSGSAMYSYGVWQGQEVRTYQLAVKLLARGDYPFQGLVSHVFPLSDYREAFQVAFDKRRHQSVKVAGAWWGGPPCPPWKGSGLRPAF